MKKIIIFTTIFILFKSSSLLSQISINNENSFILNNIYQENIFVHQNTSFLLSGEFLYYKIYCLNTHTNTSSNLSKIAYVELIGVDKKPIFKHKIRLENGKGQGDFLIPAKIQSGNYKLIAYTQWMKNSTQTNYFQSDLSIFNPFQENQPSILEKTEPLDFQTNINKQEKLQNKKNSSNLSFLNEYIDLSVNKHNFKNREQVVLKIKSLKKNLSKGNYSISVRKIDSFNTPNKYTAIEYLSTKSTTSTIKKIITLPELRGELISGKIINNNDVNLDVSNIKIALSIQGKQSIFKISTTNNLGNFYFSIPEKYESTNAIIQVIGKKRNNFNIVMDEHSSVNYETLNFYNFKITPKWKDYILKRSIYNQIEDVFSSSKPTTYKTIDSINTIYNTKAIVYNLDDYTRFPSIKETIIEIINEVAIRQKKKSSTFHIKLQDQFFEFDLPALVLVDGILVQNHNNLLDYNANNIKKISVLMDTYSLNSTIFDGVIFIETFNGNFEPDFSDTHIQKIKLFRPLITKNYFKQIYSDDKNTNRIPDYRNQLLWIPNYNLTMEEDSISFFTSDNLGEYEICIEGFTNEGIPISLKNKFKVK
ncbi:hypothetical protein [Lutibacter sp.]|uniref:hypothetical protein n=1 Tax=Lutibacter sp. TaxID=1925666 RepID=UPI0035613032